MKTFGAVFLAVALTFGAGHLLSPHADNAQYVFPSVPQNMLDSTVLIRTQIDDHTYGGSGVATSATRILTVAHLFSDAEDNSPAKNIHISVEVRKQTGNIEARLWSDAEIVKIDPVLDVAIIELTDIKLDHWALVDTESSTPVGAAAFVIGAPSSLSATTATLGYIADRGHSERLKDEHYWVSSNGSYHGNSGGPVFDANTGKVIGVLQAGINGCPNVSLFLPVSLIKGWFRA